MIQNSVEILNPDTFNRKIKRLAFQLYEDHYNAQELVICGITGRGFRLATLIAEELSKICSINILLSEVVLDKENLTVERMYLNPDIKVKGKTVILCDDVLYTGKTLAYASIPFLTHNVSALKCLVLVNRSHLQFPVATQYIGLSLATTVQEQVRVYFDEQKVTLE